MGVVTLSSKYQIVIPRDVREKMDLKPGQKIVVIEKDGVVHLIPQRPIKEMRGFVKGVNTHRLRNGEDRFDSRSEHHPLGGYRRSRKGKKTT